MKLKRFLSCILSLIFIFNIGIFPVYADDTTIEISNADEFVTFAKNCTFDSYSMGKTFVLTADIDISNSNFTDIPIFLGTFEGNNHEISGLNTDLNKDYQGLFRTIENGALVQNLNVKGNLKSEHDYIGGISAENLGTIQNCSFNGVISGKEYIGAISATNNGNIVNCTSYGGIFGESKVGGITGYNEGAIVRSNNYSKINTDISNFEFEFGGSLISSINSSQYNTDILDIGGIAGQSDGIIQNCTNQGEVGYPHIGYNIGGIVGNQNGYITDCTNLGDVFGRKEVGGIAGQFEPYISTLYSTSKLEKLNSELDILSNLTSNFTNNAKNNNTIVSNEAENLTSSINQSRLYVEDLLNQTQDLLNGNIDSLNEISVTVSSVIDDLVPITDSFTDTNEALRDVFKDLENGFDDLTAALEEYDEFSEESQTMVENASMSMLYMSKALSSFEDAIDYITISTDIEEMITGLSNSVTSFQNALTYSSNAFTFLRYATNEIETLSYMLDDVSYELQNAFNSFSDTSENMQDVMDTLDVTTGLISDLVTRLSEEEDITFVKTDENYDNAKDVLSNSIDDVSSNIDLVNNAIELTIDTILDDFNTINQQFNKVTDLLIDIIQDVTSFDDTSLFDVDDVSYDDISNITAGKILNCQNNGNINGDINIGGIVGAISFEISFDMEDDFKSDADKTQTTTRSGMAIVENSTNYGDIIAKKDGAGGIVGLQDFGLIINSTSQSKVESTDGNYVGGIVGNSAAMIKNCYSKSRLYGVQFIGGIAGFGCEIHDSYSLSTVNATDGSIGGIVGSLDTDGYLSNNYFVGDDLGGLDGISYQGKAENISYDQLMLTENLPDIFSTLNIFIYQDDEYLKTINVNYGDNFDQTLLPEIIVDNEFYGIWDNIDFASIATDIEINATLSPFLTTLSSELKSENLSVVLVDGIFTHNETLIVNEILTDDALASYEISVDGELNNIEKVRLLNMADNSKIQLLSNGEWTDLTSNVNGKYITFDIDEHDGNTISFRVVETDTFNFIIILVPVLLAILIICLIVNVIRQKIKTKVPCKSVKADDE